MNDKLTILQTELYDLIQIQQKKQKEYIKVFDRLDSQKNKYLLEDISERQKKIEDLERKIKRFRRSN